MKNTKQARKTVSVETAEKLQAKVEGLETKCQSLIEEVVRMSGERGQAIKAGFDLAKAQKQLAIITHISAGRKEDAIALLLEPLPLAFNVDVRFDDKTADVARAEMFDAMRKRLMEAVEGLRLKASGDAA